jgi:AcrR family transcriptional regulator
MSAGAGRRLGRPPAEVSAGTRARIVGAARDLFAELGYSATTNRHLAERADVTTGAIYHYFASKLELYRAVNDATQSTVYAQFESAAASAATFVDGLDRVLDVAYDLNVTQPSLAGFLGAVRVDVARNPELREMFRPATNRRERFIVGVVDLGVTTGELDAANRARAVALIRTMLIGLVHVSAEPIGHRAAIDGFKLAIKGELVRPVLAQDVIER